MTEQIAIHCLKAIICEEVCEECELYGQTGTDHCETDAVRIAIEALEKQAEYKALEEQGLLLRLPAPLDGVESFSIDGKDTWFRLPITVNEAVDKLFSHNETISLWKEIKEETSYHELLWTGMAWDIPDELKSCKFVKIFGTIPESIIQADIINIEVVLSEEAEAALEKMKGEEHEQK